MTSPLETVNPSVAAQPKAGHGAPMLRLLALLALIPTLARAELDLRPSMFSYDASFAQCTVDPAIVSAQSCADLLTDAYVLNRAVVRAMQNCTDTPLADCTAPFVDEGLTAASVRIAASLNCDRSGLATLETGAPLNDDHCIRIISDVLRDEGVVPYDQSATCTALTQGPSDCSDLILLHAQLWEDAVLDAAGEDTTLAQDLIHKIGLDCADRIKASDATAFYLGGAACATQDYAALWADLTRQNQDQ